VSAEPNSPSPAAHSPENDPLGLARQPALIDNQGTAGGAGAGTDYSSNSGGAFSAAQGAGLDLSQIVQSILRHKLLLISLSIIGLILGLIVTILSTPSYMAESRIEVNPDTVAAVDVEGASTQQITVDQTFLDTQAELLKTRELRQRIVRDQKLDLNEAIVNQELPSRDRITQAAAWLSNHSEVEHIEGTRIFRIAITSPDAKLSANIANSYAKSFISNNLNRQFETSSFAREFLSEQLEEVRGKLENSERELIGYAQDKDILELTSNDGSAGGVAQTLPASSLQQFNAAYAEARARRIAAEQRYRQAASLSQASANNDATSRSIKTELARLRAEYAQKLQIFKPDYPQMIELRRQIDVLDSSIGQFTTVDKNSRVQALAAEYKAALGEEKGLAAQVEQLKEQVSGERSLGVQYNILRRDVDTNRAVYDALLQRFKEVGVAGGNVENLITLVDPAEAPKTPVSPILAVNILLGLFGGLGLAIATGLISDMLNNTIRTGNDVEQTLGLKLIGTIPTDDEDRDFAETLLDAKSPVLEAYMSVVNQLKFSTSQGIPARLLLSSTLPGEGKSSTAYAISKVLARQHNRTLLVDCDLRMPTFKNTDRAAPRNGDLADDGQIGMVNLIVEDRAIDSAIITMEDNLHIIPVGDIPTNPAEILASEKLADLLTELQKKYDVIVLDGPAVLGFADAPILSSLASGTVMVVEAERAKINQIKSSLARLQKSNAKMIGAILTKVRPGQEGYGYDYSDSYSYGNTQPETQNPDDGKVWQTFVRKGRKKKRNIDI